jgi:eukaryotic-like serine/threonine-protein kinase
MTTGTPITSIDTIQLGHYQLLTSIGHGGMGLVYRARDTRLERDVAIKCLRRELFEAHYIERFKREALLLAKLNHPNIVQIYDYIETPDQLALVMELVDGQNLHIHLREHLVTITQRLKWLVQISEGLAVAHDAGIIHRDLKAENILISQHGLAKITDLGIAKSQDFNMTLTDHVAGSYCSMSPEQAKGESINFKSDLFSLGILAYQLLCGAHPFGDTRNKLQVMQRIITETPNNPHQHNPELPIEAIDLLGQLLSKDPNNRPDNTHWVAGQFERLVNLVRESTALNDDTQAIILPLGSSTKSGVTQDHPTFETRFTNSGKTPAELRKLSIKNYLANHKILLSVSLFTVLISVAIAIWQPFQTSNYFSENQSTEPYSQAREFNKGIEAIKQYDRPGSLNLAEKSFNRILQHTPNNAAAVAGLSIVYSLRYNGDFEDPIWLQKADASAQQAVKLNSQLALAHVAQGRVLVLHAEKEKALIAYDQALKLEPSNILALHGKIRALRLMQRYDDAITLAEQGINKFPQEGLIAVELGAIYTDQRNYPKAEQAFRLSIERQPDSVDAYAGLNVALIFQNRDDEAMQVLQQGLQIRSSEHLHGNLGTILFNKGDYVAAAASFEAAVSPDKGNPKSHLAWANLADALLWIPGRETEAKNAYRKAQELLVPLLQRKGDDVTLISRLGLYSARLGDHAQAGPLLARAIELAPENTYVQFRVGLAYELLGQREAAINALTKAVKLGYPLNLIQAEPDLVNLRRESGKF